MPPLPQSCDDTKWRCSVCVSKVCIGCRRKRGYCVWTSNWRPVTFTIASRTDTSSNECLISGSSSSSSSAAVAVAQSSKTWGGCSCFGRCFCCCFSFYFTLELERKRRMRRRRRKRRREEDLILFLPCFFYHDVWPPLSFKRKRSPSNWEEEEEEEEELLRRPHQRRRRRRRLHSIPIDF